MDMTTSGQGPESRPTRRDLLRTAAAATAATAGLLDEAPAGAASAERAAASSGRIKQSVCRWCYGKISLEDLCSAAKRMGLVGIDLLGPADFPTIKKHGLICTMVGSHPLSDGLCDPEVPGRVAQGDQRRHRGHVEGGLAERDLLLGQPPRHRRRDGLENCVKALKEIVPVAEKTNVTLNMELLNSKVDHKDYMCDRTPWGVELGKRVGSDPSSCSTTSTTCRSWKAT